MLYSAEYCNILSTSLVSSVEKMGLNDFIFMQDNDPKHKSKLTMKFFQERNIQLLNWPPQSPDMNPIENLWFIIKQEVAKFNFKNKNELKEKIREVWDSIPDELFKKLALSFKKRALDLYRVKGLCTKY